MKYYQLDPRPQGAEANEQIFSARQVLGIEVTIPALASRCSLGNLDHHGPEDTAETPCASEQALNWKPLEVSCDQCCGNAVLGDGKPCGFCQGRGRWFQWPEAMATIRPDLDSIGAMAILAIRQEGVEIGCQSCAASNNVHEGVEYICWCCGDKYDGIKSLLGHRLDAVSRADKFTRGEYPGYQTLPTTENLWPVEGAADSTRSLAAIGAAVADFKVTISERVEMMKKWLLTGKEPGIADRFGIVCDSNVDLLVLENKTFESYRGQVERERQELANALADGSIKVSTAAEGKIAVVESTHRATTAVGYAHAPVVVALNPAFKLGLGEPHRKFTVCGYSAKYVDIKSALVELSALEHGWGGSSTIGGSPQGISSSLTVEQVIEVISRHLK